MKLIQMLVLKESKIINLLINPLVHFDILNNNNIFLFLNPESVKVKSILYKHNNHLLSKLRIILFWIKIKVMFNNHNHKFDNSHKIIKLRSLNLLNLTQDKIHMRELMN